MAVVANVQINIEGKNAQAVLSSLEKQVNGLNGKFKQFQAGGVEAGSGISSAMMGIVAPLVTVGAAVAALQKSFALLGEKQADVASLENGLKGLVANSKDAATALVGIADELGKKTLFNEEDFTKGFKLLTSFKAIGVESYERVAVAAADVAQTTGQDVNSAFMQLAKALEDPKKGLTALARSGTTFNEQQTQMIKRLVDSGDQLGAQNEILKAIEGQYQNSAAAAGSAGFAGAMDTLGEVTRDAGRAIAAVLESPLKAFLTVLSTYIQKVAEGWEYLNNVIQTKIVPIIQPLIDKVKELVGNFDITTLMDLWQGGLVIAINLVADALEVLVPIAVKVVETLMWLSKNPVFQLMITPIKAVGGALLDAQGEVDKFTEKSKGSKDALVSTTTAAAQLPDPIEQAKTAAQDFLNSVTQSRNQIQQMISSLQTTNSIENARTEALQAQNSLRAKELEYAYQNAQTAQQRLQIAQQQYQNELQAADIAYQKALAKVQLDQRIAQLKEQDLLIQYKQIEAEGKLQELKADSVEKQEAIRQKTAEALTSQGEAIKIAAEQSAAQEQIAKYQIQTAQAVQEAAYVQAQMNFESKATSEQIGISAEAANRMAGSVAQSNNSAGQLASSTNQVGQYAGTAAVEYGNLAGQAASAAQQINAAAAAQERLNAARGGGGGGGGGGNVQAAAEGAYWRGGFTAFAKGGVVKGPTLGLIGEGGEPEYIIPESKAAGFATNYLAGVRGGSAVPKFADGGYVTPSANVSIQTGPVTQMNGTNYVTTQDLSRAVQAGVNQTLSLIAGDGSVRRQLGIA